MQWTVSLIWCNYYWCIIRQRYWFKISQLNGTFIFIFLWQLISTLKKSGSQRNIAQSSIKISSTFMLNFRQIKPTWDFVTFKFVKITYDRFYCNFIYEISFSLLRYSGVLCHNLHGIMLMVLKNEQVILLI